MGFVVVLQAEHVAGGRLGPQLLFDKIVTEVAVAARKGAGAEYVPEGFGGQSAELLQIAGHFEGLDVFGAEAEAHGIPAQALEKGLPRLKESLEFHKKTAVERVDYGIGDLRRAEVLFRVGSVIVQDLLKGLVKVVIFAYTVVLEGVQVLHFFDK